MGVVGRGVGYTDCERQEGETEYHAHISEEREDPHCWFGGGGT